MSTYELVLTTENKVMASVRAYAMSIAVDYFKERGWPLDKRLIVRDKEL